MTPDGQLVSGSDEGLHLHNVETLKRTKAIASKIEKIYSLVVSPDGQRIAVAGGAPADLKGRIATAQEMDSLTGGENYKRWQEEYLR